MPHYDRTVTLTDQAGNSINLGNPLPTTGSGGGGGGAVTIADGADTAEGATTDAAVTGDNPGSVSAKLRGLGKIFFDVWDSVNHALKVNLVSGSAGQADNSTYTEGASSFTPVGGEYNTSPGAVTSGKAAATQITQHRALHINLRDASGSEEGTSGNPVRIDPTGTTTQPVSGSVSVSNFPATQPVSGTVTGNQGAPNTAANSWPVEVTDGTNVLGTSTHPVRTDPTGTTTQPVSGSVSVSNFPATQPVSGTVTGNQGSPNIPANSWPVEVTDGTNVLGTASHPVRTDPTGTTTQPVSGTVSVGNFPATQPVSGTVTGNQGAPNTAANSWPVEVTDGTNVLGTSGHPIRVDPTGTTTQPVSGSVSVSNFPATQPVSGTVTGNQGTPNTAANSWPVEVTDGTNVLGTAAHPIRTDPTGTTTQPVSGTVAVSNFPATQPVSGTVTGNQGAPNTAANSWPVEVTDGTNVLGTPAHPIRTDPTGTTTQPVSGTVTGNQGTPNTAANSWPVEVTDGTNVLGTSIHPIRTDPTGTTTQPVSGTVTANQGTAAATASAWPVELTDGVNVAAVKASGTAATTADPAGVVALSPNSSLPAGTSLVGAVSVQGTSGPITSRQIGNDTVLMFRDDESRRILEEIQMLLTRAEIAALSDRPEIVNVAMAPIAVNPYLQTMRVNYTAAQTGATIVSCPPGSAIMVTRIMATLDKGTSVNAAVRIGFGGNTTPTGSGVVASHPGLDPGGGFVTGGGEAVIAVGGPDQNLLVDSGSATGGSLDIVVSYYLSRDPQAPGMLN